jgi:putative protease
VKKEEAHMTNKKPELLTTAGSPAELELVFGAGADAVVIGQARYALRMAGDFQLPEIEEAARTAKRFGGKIYVAVNALLHHEVLQELPDYLRRLEEIGIHAVVFGDPAVYQIARTAAPALPLQWNAETTSTSSRSVNFWAKKGITRAVLSLELSLANVLGIKQQTKIEIQAQVHGLTCIFHSKRSLVSNYLHYHDIEETPHASESHLFLQEHKREGQHYPIFEDVHGTHILSDTDICMLEHLPALIAGGIDSLKIEGLYKSPAYNEAAVRIYRQALDRLSEDLHAPLDPAWRAELEQIQPADRPLSTGFYFKEQIY